MQRIRHITPAFRTHAGDAALDQLPGELALAGASRVLVVHSRALSRQPSVLDLVYERLSPLLVASFGDVDVGSPLPVVVRVRDLIRLVDADSVVVVGGGSAVVTARAAVIMAAEGRDIRELATYPVTDDGWVSPRLMAPKLPQWIVPTTPSTAYAKAGSAVHDPETGERLALFDPKARAKGVLLDPRLAVTAPVEAILPPVLNAFCMAIEGLASLPENPLAEALLLGGLRDAVAWLPRLADEPGNAVPRLHLMFASLLVGQGSDHAGGGLTQALAHAAGMQAGVPNGVVEAILLPHVLRYNGASATDSDARALDALGDVDDGADSGGSLLESVARFLRSARVPTRLRDVGVPDTAFPAIVDRAMADWFFARVPRSASRESLQRLLEDAW